MRGLSHGQKRIGIFAAVGAACFGSQLALLTVMVHLGADRPIANAIGFAISAQLNFLLSSKLTWRDRPVSGRRDAGARWLGYNGTALVWGVNTAVFTLVYHAIGTTPAAALGVVLGTCIVYLTCNLLVFRGARQAPGRSRRPCSRRKLARRWRNTTGTISGGVAVVMPAFREEANLAGTVEDMLAALDTMGDEHLVVIVNDGSDRTGEVADELADDRYPGRVHVVHHEVNKGYGAAVRTGIATALDRTDVPWVFLTDSDGQFKSDELPRFVAEARAERADAVIGFRPRRADPTMRKVNAWLWTRCPGCCSAWGPGTWTAPTSWLAGGCSTASSCTATRRSSRPNC